jgi:hypothetical protein
MFIAVFDDIYIYEGWDWGKPQHKTTTADAKKAALP